MKMVNVVVTQRWFVKSNYLKQKQLRIRINFSKTIVSQKIKCSHILVAKQSEALAILDRIKNGEKFGKLAKELSTDTGSAKRDGNLQEASGVMGYDMSYNQIDDEEVINIVKANPEYCRIVQNLSRNIPG